MKTRSMRHLVMALAVAVVALLAGCGASGPAFKPIDPPANGQGVVYIYRQSSGLGAGVHGTLRANGKAVTDVKNGGYFPYVGPPGEVKFEVHTEASNDATVNVEGGIEKFLKVTVGMGFFVGHLHLTEVSPEIGKKEIAECKLLEPAKP
jgi:hypothetical protein